MHEITLCQRALELIEQQAAKHGAKRVTGVWLKIGAFSCVETKDGEDKQRIAQAQLSIDGMIDGKVNIRDREQVLEHYLEKIAGVYDSLYTAIENNVPVNLSQLVKGQSPAA
ncbi:hydrogenase/urease maturation nickel metallochaperone HypA [Escherichia coli]|uniref:hydrogenase/urease maturation nickel metallochaperone HypA n=1 Tax=Escherichia coli TaxID=562 RepID=UPI00111F3420|nr:hydrogenase/urease maturation nickel metallochaperone HypA [Escherichia coli]TNT90103.1 hypothetical protein FIB78_07930 [Escherichia coli]